MTDDEVQLIYDYLHDNYRYEDGSLLRIKSCNGWFKGHKLGTFSHNDKWNKPCVKAIIKINKKPICSLLSHLIWIYHYKKKPMFLEHIDNNPTNTVIENLKEISVVQVYRNNMGIREVKGTFEIKNKKDVKYRALIHVNNKNVYLGHYDSESSAYEIYKTAVNAINLGIIEPLDIKNYVNKNCAFSTCKISTNKNGFKGIKKTKYGTYYGRCEKKGLRIQTKCYKTPEEAHAAYLKAKEEYRNV